MPQVTDGRHQRHGYFYGDFFVRHYPSNSTPLIAHSSRDGPLMVLFQLVACRKASHVFAPSHSQCHSCHQLQLQGGSPELRSIPSVMVRVNLLVRLLHHLMRRGRLSIREESDQCVLIPGVPCTVVSSFEPMGVRLPLRQQRIWLLLKCGGL